MTAKFIHSEIESNCFQSAIVITEDKKIILRHAIERIDKDNSMAKYLEKMKTENETILKCYIIDYCNNIIKVVVNLP